MSWSDIFKDFWMKNHKQVVVPDDDLKSKFDKLKNKVGKEKFKKLLREAIKKNDNTNYSNREP